MKAKPTKWGITVFVLSNATNGYIYKMQVYTGKNLGDDGVDVGLCSRVALEQMSGLENDDHCVFTNNYYTSPQLAFTLYNKGINSRGTVRTSRSGHPKDLVRKKAYQGYSDYRSNGPLLAVAWHDCKMVYFLSTMHLTETSDISTVTIQLQNAFTHPGSILIHPHTGI